VGTRKKRGEGKSACHCIVRIGTTSRYAILIMVEALMNSYRDFMSETGRNLEIRLQCKLID
jgi:hypothetical protein